MPTSGSRYRPAGAPDYGHRFHAGNVGDVWKHCALAEVLRRVGAAGTPVRFLDTHAGEGWYRLGSTGEWTEGIGRLWGAAAPAARSDAAAAYVALCRRFAAGTDRPDRYPGSPVLARAVLGERAPLTLWERHDAAFARLAAHTAGDAHVRLVHGDGLQALDDDVRAAEAAGAVVVVLIDPPWTQKADWTRVPEVLARAARGSARACLMLWYPVKSLTRPNAMIGHLQAAGVAGTIAELITTPLGERRRRLNGSGVLLVRPPDGVLEALAAAAPAIGAPCATQPGQWSFRIVSWAGD